METAKILMYGNIAPCPKIDYTLRRLEYICSIQFLH